MRKFPSLLTIVSLACFSGCSASEPGPDICEQAIDLLDECTNTYAAYPAEGCVGTYEQQATAIVEGGCEGLMDEWPQEL